MAVRSVLSVCLSVRIVGYMQ